MQSLNNCNCKSFVLRSTAVANDVSKVMQRNVTKVNMRHNISNSVLYLRVYVNAVRQRRVTLITIWRDNALCFRINIIGWYQLPLQPQHQNRLYSVCIVCAPINNDIENNEIMTAKRRRWSHRQEASQPVSRWGRRQHRSPVMQAAQDYNAATMSANIIRQCVVGELPSRNLAFESDWLCCQSTYRAAPVSDRLYRSEYHYLPGRSPTPTPILPVCHSRSMVHGTPDDSMSVSQQQQSAVVHRLLNIDRTLATTTLVHSDSLVTVADKRGTWRRCGHRLATKHL